MLFNSYIFIFLFLPATLLGYYTMNHFRRYQAGKAVLVLASLVFYGYNHISYIFVMLSSIMVNYSAFLLMKHFDRHKKWILFAGILFNLLLLGYFKYYDFLIENLNLLLHSNFDLLNIMLPLGISFFTFQQVSFLIDSCRGECDCKDFLDYILFVTFFPQLVAGPIVSHDEIIPQLAETSNKQLNPENLTKGIQAFSIGLFKKVIIADSFGRIVTHGYTFTDSLNSFEALLTIISYTIQIYYDFSGYCDMASGIAWMFNISLPVNFHSPYKATTILDFWKSWHITLTRFLTKYIYVPLGGNRRGTVRTYVNIFIVFLVSGIWHGAGYTFILWGIVHGIANILCRIFKKQVDSLPKWLNWIMTFLFLNGSWVLFRANSVDQAMLLLRRIFAGGLSIGMDLRNTLTQLVLVDLPYQFLPLTVILTIYTVAALAVAVFGKNTAQITQKGSCSTGLLVGSLFMFLLSVLSLSGVSTFLYFNF